MRIVLLTNILTPYRIFFFDRLEGECQKRKIQFTVIVMAETEPGRDWKYSQYQRNYTVLLKGKSIVVQNIILHFNTGLKKIYQEIKPNIVVCAGSYLYPSLWETLRLKRKFHYKVLYWSESHLNERRNYSRLKYHVREQIRKRVISRFDAYWYAGEFSKQLLEKYAKQGSKYIFLPNLVNPEIYNSAVYFKNSEKNKIAQEYLLNRNKKIFIIPARLAAEKGIIEFLTLFKDIKYKNNATIIIPGRGNLKEKIEEMATEYHLDIRLLGIKQESEMVKLYAVSDALILPSVSDSNPLSVIEACWAGLPILLSEHVGNYPEIVHQGINGYVFSYKSPEKAKRIIDQMISASSDWYRHAGEVSHGIAENLYNPNTAVPRILSQTIECCGK